MVQARVVFHHRDGNWSREGSTWSRGTIIHDDEVLEGAWGDDLFSSGLTMAEIVRRMKDLNGQYAIVHVTEEHAYAAVDRMRSIPLFYSYGKEMAYVSDDPFWIMDQLGDRSIDERNRAEYLMTGYVTDDRTLSPHIKQVRPGELVHLRADPRDGVVREREQYQCYVPRDFTVVDLERGLEEMEVVMVHCFQRLMAHARGRTLVVPLSGGVDSRLVVLMLRRLGAENVITFSYGREGSAEVVISKKVAQTLGYPWLFIEYSNDKWWQWKNSEDHDRYTFLANGLVSSPHMQEYPAVMVLKREGSIPEDSIFVPGHTVALTNKPDMTGPPDQLDLVIEDIYRKHYNLAGEPSSDPKVKRWCKDNIAASLGDLGRYPDRHSASDSWDYANRQAKFIVNSVRVYDHWGYDWWLPLEDKEFCDFWCRVPSELRTDKVLVKGLVDKLSEELMAGADVPYFHRRMQSKEMKRMAEMVARNKRLSKLFGHPFYYFRKRTIYDTHPQAYYGMVSWKRFRKEYNGRQTVNYFIATDFLDRLNKVLLEGDKVSR